MVDSLNEQNHPVPLRKANCHPDTYSLWSFIHSHSSDMGISTFGTNS
ncbi:MAG: hypothetical protein JWR26_2237 [Pedosphaera sp.]|nr:hypothetical protein [Pedosphaera sp.]